MKYPIYLINLDRQPGRLEFMRKQLKALSLSPIRIPAVNGREPAALAKSAVASYAMLTPGEVGCFESHRSIWKKMITENIDGAFILEDDIIVSSDFASLNFDHLQHTDTDIIKIDETTPGTALYGTNEEIVSEGRSIIRMLGSEVSTGCYFLTLAGARKLNAMASNYILPVDTFMFSRDSLPFASLQVYKLRPAAAIQIYRVKNQSILSEDFSDRIQGAARPELAKGIWPWLRMQRLRLRRLFDRDTKINRENRAKKIVLDFKSLEATSTEHISFHTESTDHYAELIKNISEV